MLDLKAKLHAGAYSCVIRNGANLKTFTRKGVIDLFELYETCPQFLKGASVADKVVGKGAAALMVIGGVAEVYADTMSQPALKLLQEHGVGVTYSQLTTQIMNRSHDGFCPVESLCMNLDSVDEMYAEISRFLLKDKYGKGH